MAIEAGSVFVNLGAKLERHEFDLYERELRKVQEKTAKKDLFKAELGGKFDSRAFNSYQRELTKTDKAMDETSRHTNLLGGHTQKLSGHLKAAAGAAIAAGSAYAGISAAKSAITVTEDLAKTTLSLHKNLGLSIKSASEWAAVAKTRGVEGTKLAQTFAILSKNVEAGTLGFDNMNAKSKDLQSQMEGLGKSTKDQTKLQELQDRLHKSIAKGAGAQAEAFKKLGVTEDDLKSGDFNDVLGKVSDGLGKMHAGTEKTALSVKLFGKGWQSIVPIIRDGSKAMNEQLALAEKYGVTFEGKTVTSLKELIAAQREAKFATMGLQVAFGLQLAPTMTKAIGIANKFVIQMREGTGTGGDFLDVLKGIGKALGWLFTTTKHAIDGMLGFFSTVIRGEGAVAGLLGKLHPGNDAMDRFAKNAQVAADKIDRFREKLHPTPPSVRKLSDEIETANSSLKTFHDRVNKMRFDGLRKALADSQHDLVTKIGGGSHDAFNALDKNSYKGIKAASGRIHQFGATVDTGMAHVQSSLSKELKTLGGADLKPFSGKLTVAGTSNPLPKAGGGWIGAPGLVGDDTVPALLAPGEAVLNRHQQAIIEGLLGGGFLDRLFASVQRPHYMATGGMVGAANRLDSAHFPYQWGGGHQSSPAKFGPMDCSGAVSYVLQQGGVGIPTMTSGMLMNAGAQGGGQVTVFANPSHTFMRIGQRYFGTSGTNPGGGAGWFPAPGAGYLSRFAQRHFMGGQSGFGDIKAPTVGGSGALRAIAQAALGLTARAANSAASRVGLGTGDAGDPGPGRAGSFSFGALRSLWTSVGGAARRAAIMAHIAEAESGGDPSAKNPSGASGLWQILGLPFAGDPFDPSTNARMAKAKSSNGVNLNPWNASRAAWGQFANRGGFIQRFASGGKPKSKRKPIPKPSAASKARDYIRPLASLQTDRASDYDMVIGHVDDLNTQYTLRERTYDLSVEELVKPDGSIDEAAIKKHANELLGLVSIRQRIIDQLESARVIARRIINTYNTIITRLRKSLTHAKGKSRASIRQTIGTYGERRDEWSGKLHELEVSTLPSARLDLRELQKERRDVLGTTSTADTGAADSGGGDTGSGGGDTGSGGGDTATVAPTPADIAAAAIQDFSNYLAGARDLYSSFGANSIAANRAGGMFLNPDVATATAGARFFGATGGGILGGATGQGVTIVNHYNQLPDNTADWSSQMRFQVEAAT